MTKGSWILAIALIASAETSCKRRSLEPDEIERNRIFAEILMREDQRILGDDRFFPTHLETSPFPEVREWCAVALGRIGNPAALPWLYAALDSPFARVRAAAAFAVGEIEDREILKAEFRRVDALASLKLIERLDDSSLQVRMRATEALGKVGLSADADEIARRLESFSYGGSPEEQAYIGIAITALMRLREPVGIPVLERLARLPDPEIQWRAANALYRMRAKGARATFLLLLRSPHPEVRAHAARAIGICEDPSLARLLLDLLDAAEPLSVRVCALQALGVLRAPEAVPAIRRAIGDSAIHPSDSDRVNFAVQAAAALGNIRAPDSESVLVPLLDTEGPVADSALIALAKLSSGREDKEQFLKYADPSRFRSPPATRAWAQSMGELGGDAGFAQLRTFLIRSASEGSPDDRSVTLPAALTALARIQPPGLREILQPFLAARDGVVLRAAVAAYKPDASEKTPWKPLIEAYSGIAAGNDIEAKNAVLEALEPWLQVDEVRRTLRTALEDRRRNVRSTAIRLLRISGETEIPHDPGPSETTLTSMTYQLLAGARIDRTVAVLETTRGTIEIELFRRDAPITSANFASLARAGYFDGLTFMRVVPFFVIQGGDPRNDQEGGPGYTIRCEINRRPFERGSVGMALSGKDTGGSQFFITHAPQPHLDGGYTCFGRVISGMQVVDRMVAGDRIVRVRIVEEKVVLDSRRY